MSLEITSFLNFHMFQVAQATISMKLGPVKFDRAERNLSEIGCDISQWMFSLCQHRTAKIHSKKRWSLSSIITCCHSTHSGPDSICQCFQRYGRLLPPFAGKVPLCTQSHWLICSRKRRSLIALISCLMYPPGLNCVTLQEVHVHAIAFGSRNHMVLRNLAQSFGAWHCSLYLENLAALPWW
jgi:hypothetical protein